MKIIGALFRSLLSLTVATVAWSPPIAATAAPRDALPELILSGFASWTRGGSVDVVLSGWEKGGLMEGSNRAAAQARYIKDVMRAIGNYRDYEVLQFKDIGRSSRVAYLSINFERGAVYARFLLYRSGQNWVVQNMEYNVRPEAIMPWLALESEGNTQ